jgi:2-polyprenyl-3-methyl-5-hydroxy-6-metoxy-1,4-benzoquinol methylase
LTSCCSASSLPGTNKFFSKLSKRYVRQFRKRGLAKEQRSLLQGMTLSSIAGNTILDIGCGIGGLHFALLERGASRATGVDVSEGMLGGARVLSSELGYDGRTNYLLGDFMELNGNVPDADIVILDKVVCCYENVDALVRKSIGKTKNLYAISFPRPHPLNRMMTGAATLLVKTLRRPFHPYWHDWNRMVRLIRDEGFTELYSSDTFVWAVRVFKRS